MCREIKSSPMMKKHIMHLKCFKKKWSEIIKLKVRKMSPLHVGYDKGGFKQILMLGLYRRLNFLFENIKLYAALIKYKYKKDIKQLWSLTNILI